MLPAQRKKSDEAGARRLRLVQIITDNPGRKRRDVARLFGIYTMQVSASERVRAETHLNTDLSYLSAKKRIAYLDNTADSSLSGWFTTCPGCVACAKCATCGEPAACIGAYEGSKVLEFACNTCCMHGCEDGHCDLLDALNDGRTCVGSGVFGLPEGAWAGKGILR